MRCRRSRRPSASSSIHSRSRGHSRSSASWATSTEPSPTVTRRLSASIASTSAVVLVALEVELGERRAAAYGGVALALADQAQHEGAHERLPLVRDPGVRALGQARDGAVHAAGLAVGGQRERVVLPLLPELEQRGREQRQRARLALDVVDERVGQLRLDAQPDPARRAARRRGAAPRPASARPARGWRRAARRAPGRRRSGRRSRRAARPRRPRDRAGSAAARASDVDERARARRRSGRR